MFYLFNYFLKCMCVVLMCSFEALEISCNVNSQEHERKDITLTGCVQTLKLAVCDLEEIEQHCSTPWKHDFWNTHTLPELFIFYNDGVKLQCVAAS